MVRKEKKRKRYPDVASRSTLWRRRRCEVMAVHGPSHSVHVVKLSITIWKKKSKIWNFKNIPAWGCVSWDHVVSGLDLRHSRWEKKLCLWPKRCRQRPVLFLSVPRHVVLCPSPVAIRCCPIWIVVVGSNLVLQVASQRGSMSHCRVQSKSKPQWYLKLLINFKK